MPVLALQTKTVVIRHITERHKASNTGGLFARLTHGQLLDYGAQNQPLALDWLDESCVLVFPGARGKLPLKPKLVLLDGTWNQVRRMYRKIPGLSRLPCIGLPPRETSIRMRIPTVQGGMSTLEAGALAMSSLEGEETTALLLQFFDRMTERQLRLRGNWKE
jgi:DTW domain-containing protein YfiP